MSEAENEYWFLESAIDYTTPLTWLTAKNGGEILNKKEHGLSFDVVLATMFKLAQNGDIFAVRMSNFRCLHKKLIINPHSGIPIPLKEIGDRFIPTLADLETGLRDDEPIDYGLTAKGGARWEELSQPRWDQYFADSYQSSDDENSWETEIIATDKTIVEQYLHFTRKWDDDVFIPGSEMWDVITPWEVTYWKTLPMGHRLQFRCRDSSSSLFDHPEYRAWLSAISKWYTNPYT